VVEAWPGGHAAALRGPDRPGGEDDRSVGARSIFSTPPPILACLGEARDYPDPDADSFWVVDEVRGGKERGATPQELVTAYSVPQARHLIDTFGGRGIRDWHRCKRDGGCRDDGCICRFVQAGVDHYGEWGSPISEVLASVATMADDEAMADSQSTSTTEPY